MPKRHIIDFQGQKFIVLPYTGFANLGIATDPPIPLAAFPMFNSVEKALVGPLSFWKAHQQRLKEMRFDTVGKILQQRNEPTLPLPKNAGLYEANAVLPEFMFRGESREEFGAVPSILRDIESDSLAAFEQIYQTRRAKEIAVAERLRTTLDLTLFEARSIGRHYGVQSAMIDFTFDPRIAAHFAHPRFNEAERKQRNATPIGAIYCLKQQTLRNLFLMQGFKLDGQSIVTTIYGTGDAAIPYIAASVDPPGLYPAELRVSLPDLSGGVTIRTTTSPRSARIRAQQGLFFEIGRDGGGSSALEIAQLWYILDFASEKWCFLRRDKQFESGGLNAKSLFPRDDIFDAAFKNAAGG